jgi:hypothetical protein
VEKYFGKKIKNSVTNSLFEDLIFSEKGKKYCKDFCQASKFI